MKKVLLLFLVLFVSLFVAVGSDRNIVYAEEYPGYAYAVLTADGDLIFFRSNDIYEDGKQTVTDIKQNEYTGTVFTGVEDGSVTHSWDEYASKIRRIYVAEEQTFAMPDGMKFSNLSRLLSFDGSGFDTGSVTSMANMFSGCNNLTSLNLHGVDTSSVRNMSYMFSNCSSLGTIDIRGLDTGSVETMTGMFSGCAALESLDMSELDLRNASSISSMFSGCNNLRSIDLSKSKVRYVENMFSGCSSLSSIDLTGIDTREVTSMYRMFYGCSSLASIDLSSFNTGNVTNMSGMFSGCSSLRSVDLSRFNTGKVTTVSGMFNGCSRLTAIDINGLDLGNVTSMYGLFSGCSSLTALDLSGLDTRKLNTLSYIFSRCENLRTLDMSGLDLRNVTAVENMFSGCNSLLSIDLGNSKVKNVSNMFSECISLNSLILNGIDTSSVISMDYMFSGCSSLTSLDLSDINSSNVTSMSHMFSGCSSLASLDLRRLNTSRVSSMAYIFSDCSGLTSVNLSGLNTSNVTDMSGMFSGCSSLKTFRLSTLSTDSVTDMSYMFSGCSSLESLDLYNVETGKVTSMSNLFSGCSSLTSLDLGGLDTGNVVNMSGMFSGCSKMTSIDFSGFETGKAEDMSKLFYDCSSIAELDLRVFDTSRVRDMSNMFSGCSSLASLDLSSFDAYSVTSMNDMFIPCDNLGKIVIGAWFDKWDSPLPGDDQWDHGGLLKTPAEIAEGFSTHASEWAGTWERIRTYAVLSESGDLVFLNSKNTVKNKTETQIVDIKGVRYTGIVFTYANTISEWSSSISCPWNGYSINGVYVSDGNKIRPVSTNGWFSGCSTLESFDSTGFDTSATTTMNNMFYGCYNLMYVVLDPQCTTWNALLPGDDSWEHNGIKKTPEEIAEGFRSHITEWAGTWERIKTYAVFTGSGDLVFINSKEPYNDRTQNQIKDIKGNKHTGTVYYYLNGITEWGDSWWEPGDLWNRVPWENVRSQIKKVYVAKGSIIKPLYLDEWFSGCSSLSSFSASSFDTSNALSMSGMFRDCISLAELNLSSFDTHNVTSMYDMLTGCKSLCSLDISSFDTSGITAGIDSSFGMIVFQDCSSLLSIKLGTRIDKKLAIPPMTAGDGYNWINGDIVKSSIQLGHLYPQHSTEWAGTWKRELYPVSVTTALNIGTGILVKWNQVGIVSDNEEERPTGYVIYRRAMKAGSNEWTTFARWNNTTECSFLDTNVYEGTKYQYGIKAYYGNDPSTTKWLGPVGPMSTALVYSKKPPAPTVTTSKNTDNGIEISWDKVKDAAGYVIYRRAWSSSTGGWTEFQRWNNTTSTSWTDTKVYAGTKYQYGIKAYYGDDPKNMAHVGSVGPLSTNVRITTRVITRLIEGNHDDPWEGDYRYFWMEVTVDYDKSSVFTGYQVQYAGNVEFSDKKTITISNPKTSSVTFTYYSPSSPYPDWACYVRVRSYHVFNGITYYGAWSNYGVVHY